MNLISLEESAAYDGKVTDTYHQLLLLFMCDNKTPEKKIGILFHISFSIFVCKHCKQGATAQENI
jgi:hypothetical protein